MSDDKYLDPAQNPFIKIQQDDIPWPVDDGEALSVDVERPIDLPDIKTGLFPGEKKAEAAARSAPDKIKAFMQARPSWAVNDSSGQFRFEVQKDGQGGLVVSEVPGKQRPMTAADVALIEASIEAE